MKIKIKCVDILGAFLTLAMFSMGYIMGGGSNLIGALITTIVGFAIGYGGAALILFGIRKLKNTSGEDEKEDTI